MPSATSRSTRRGPWRFYEQAFGWTVTPDADDGYGDVRTNGVCLGTGEPGIPGQVEIALFRDPAGNRIGLVRG